jgi:Protein of unknown function (DUF3455)
MKTDLRHLCWVLFLALLACPLGEAQPRISVTAPKVPNDFHPPKGFQVLFTARAEGVQIYEGKAEPGKTNRFEWAFLGPRADLFDDQGAKIGKHYAGPTWEATDGSKVVAAKKVGYNAPNPSAVPWLLLQATKWEGKGKFTRVKYIQRVETWAGQPPARKPTRAKVGKQVEVKYQATYVFYGAPK